VYQENAVANDQLNLNYNVGVFENSYSLDSLVISKSLVSSLIELAYSNDSLGLLAVTWRNSRLLGLHSVARVSVQPVKITQVTLTRYVQNL